MTELPHIDVVHQTANIVLFYNQLSLVVRESAPDAVNNENRQQPI